MTLEERLLEAGARERSLREDLERRAAASERVREAARILLETATEVATGAASVAGSLAVEAGLAAAHGAALRAIDAAAKRGGR